MNIKNFLFFKENYLQLNKHKIEIVSFNGSNIYFINNFYKNPYKLKKWILTHKSNYHKQEEQGYNGIYFDDMRHSIKHEGMKYVSSYLSNLCNQKSQSNVGEEKIITNLFKFKDSEFNDYENNYWYPHKDSGYTAIIYFDDSDTNLYECLDPHEENCIYKFSEHQIPWRSKQKWQKIATLHGKFNKMILFDGSKFFHGASIESKKYTNQYRMNQVVFFKQ